MFINPVGEKHPFEKGKIIQTIAICGVTKKVFLDHTPGLNDIFGVCLIDHEDCISARVAISKQDAEWLTSDTIPDPCWYCFLTLEQITKLDPYCGQALQEQFK